MKGSPEALASQSVLEGPGGHQGLSQSAHQVRAPLDQPFSIKVQVGVAPGGWEEVLGCVGTGQLAQSGSESPGRGPRSEVGSKDVIGEEGPALARVVRGKGLRKSPSDSATAGVTSAAGTQGWCDQNGGEEPHKGASALHSPGSPGRP